MVPSSPAGADTAISRFITEIPDKRLINEKWSDQRVGLELAAPDDFFARGSQPANATITGFDLADGILRLDMKGAEGHHIGSFSIDLTTFKLVRVVIDGKDRIQE